LQRRIISTLRLDSLARFFYQRSNSGFDFTVALSRFQALAMSLYGRSVDCHKRMPPRISSSVLTSALRGVNVGGNAFAHARGHDDNFAIKFPKFGGRRTRCGEKRRSNKLFVDGTLITEKNMTCSPHRPPAPQGEYLARRFCAISPRASTNPSFEYLTALAHFQKQFQLAEMSTDLSL
jgi:hypothetical protein